MSLSAVTHRQAVGCERRWAAVGAMSVDEGEGEGRLRVQGPVSGKGNKMM